MAFYSNGTSRIYHQVAGQGEPVLMLPGFSEQTTDHAALLADLAARYLVVAADLPGSGRSLPQPRSYTATYYREDADALSALIRTLTDSPVHLVGFSDGGEVALLIAALYPDLVRSVLVWGAAGALPSSSDPLFKGLDRLFDDPVSPFAGWAPHLIDRYGEQNARGMMRNFISAMRTIVAAGGDISRSMADQIVCPVLLIAGEHDPFIPKFLADDFAGAVRNGTAVEVAGAGHDVHNVRPAWFNQTVCNWLSRN